MQSARGRGRNRAAQSRLHQSVTSLIDGVAAIATAQIGDLVGPSTLLTTVSQVDPIKAYFPLSEQDYLQVRRPDQRSRRGESAVGERDAHAGARRRHRVPEARTLPRGGSRDRSEDRHDPHQRGVSEPGSRAAARAVRPRARRNARSATDALLVPQRAVASCRARYHVRVVGSDNKVATRTVVHRANASAAGGSSNAASRPATASWSRAPRCATAPW